MEFIKKLANTTLIIAGKPGGLTGLELVKKEVPMIPLVSMPDETAQPIVKYILLLKN